MSVELPKTGLSQDRGPEQAAAKISLLRRRPVTFVDVAGADIPIPSDIHDYHSAYINLTRASLDGFLVQREQPQAGDTEFVVVGPALTAKGVNELMYFTAPSKTFYLDTYDVIDDWLKLYNGSAENRARLKRHRSMPGWEIFEQSKEKILGLLTRNFDRHVGSFRDEDPTDIIRPVIHGRRDASGNVSLILDPMDEELAALVSEQTGQTSDQLDKNLGLLLVAAVSPENAMYPGQSGYGNAEIKVKPKIDDDNEPEPEPNTMGPTQVLALAIRRIAEKQNDPSSVPDTQDIQQSSLLKTLASYIETGRIPRHFTPQALAQRSLLARTFEELTEAEKPLTNALNSRWAGAKRLRRSSEPVSRLTAKLRDIYAISGLTANTDGAGFVYISGILNGEKISVIVNSPSYFAETRPYIGDSEERIPYLSVSTKNRLQRLVPLLLERNEIESSL